MKKQPKLFIGIIASITVIVAVVIAIVITAVGGSKDTYNSHMELAQRYLNELKYEQAIAEYNLAIAIQPNNVDAYLALAEIYVNMEDYESAISVLESGIEQTGSDELANYLEKVMETYQAVPEVMEDGSEIEGRDTEDLPIAEGEANATVAADASGAFGDNLAWKITGNTLIISGKGEMPDYGNFIIDDDSDYSVGISGSFDDRDIPWYYMRDEIENIVIESGITYIGSCSFSGTNVTNVVIADSVVSIGEAAFFHCSDLVDINIPNSVVSIGGGAFCGCSSLVDITIPEGVTAIKGMTFSDCTRLNSITLPNTITEIKNGAFMHCENLKNIRIPNGVTVIGNWTFSGCYSITSVTIPNSVICIKDYSFNGCSNLADIYYEGSESSWYSIERSHYTDGDDDLARILDRYATIHYNSIGMGSGEEDGL